ncbi:MULTISPECIES: erythromycin esterase family protein [Tsukamurella]|uniref:Erythromycin esterase family protein n=2 Tax=Tsukamurella TaxID=2060 RepID=A0A5C5S369_9ACTN|nr:MULTISPECIES: erythromycin esterase family protein [Tsukamurella]NMD56475.1 erythromycin esterase family protein [Tsukamurella columbiensis]TWS29180.1 erythromycin esterase family protein [Tsukamurella conjunctivitidis]
MNPDQVDLVSYLAAQPAPTRLLALGEPMHGSEEILRARNAVIEDLVLRGGYRSIAVESDFHRAPLVNDYLAGADLDLERVLDEGFSHPYVHRLAATGELLESLRELNRTLETPVRFYGFDGPMEMAAAPSPRAYLLRLRAALAAVDEHVVGEQELEDLLGDEARWTDEQAMYEADRGVGRTVDVERLRLLTDDLCAVLQARAPELTEPAEAWWELRADAATAVGLLRYHAIMATDTPDRLGRLSAHRDAMMGRNLLAILDREADRGGTIAFAHNLHLQRGASEMRMGPHVVRWFSGGAQAAARLRDGYRFVAMGIGAAPAHGLAVPASGTVEGELYRRQDAPARLYAGSELAARLGEASPRADRDALGAYFPLDAARLAETDGVLFLREVRA